MKIVIFSHPIHSDRDFLVIPLTDILPVLHTMIIQPIMHLLHLDQCVFFLFGIRIRIFICCAHTIQHFANIKGKHTHTHTRQKKRKERKHIYMYTCIHIDTDCGRAMYNHWDYKI